MAGASLGAAIVGRPTVPAQAGGRAEYRALARRKQLILIGLAALLAASLIVDLMTGPARYGVGEVIRVADRVMVLAEGRLVAVGDPLAVITPDLLAEVYGVRARVEGGRAATPPHVIVEGSARHAPIPYLRAAE
jgi:hypothetical protein